MRRAVYGAALMRSKDKCPSCFQPVAPDDFLCANCELILSPSLATTRPVGEISVVRRLLELPQRGVPSNLPTRPQTPAISLGEPGFEGPTRVMSLPPEIDGVPVVVATLSKPAVALTELEAWVVSLIDGLHDAPALVTAAAVRRVTGDAHFQEARTLRTAVAWWLLTNVNLEDVKWPPELVASAREAQRKHGTTLTDEQLRRLRRYEEVETPLKRHETMAFDATNAVHVASEVLAHRFGLRTRVSAAKVGVSSKLLPPRGALSDLGLDQLLAGDVEETARGVNERWVRFGRPTDPAFIVLLKKSADGSWRASPQQEAAASLTAIAKALDGDDEASLRDALRVLVAARAARMPNPASVPGPVVVKALLSALAEPPVRPPSPAFRARVAKWLHFGDDVRREVAMLQHAWGWPDDARATAERLPADLQLRFDLARLRGDFALAETLVNDADALQASACDVALRLGKTACFTGARQAARAQLKGVERSNELNNLAWAAVFSDAELWPDALVDAREAAELDANFGSVGTRVVLEALVGAPADFAASVDAFWAARPPSTVDTQFLTFALAVQAERLGFTDEAMRLYAQVKPLVPQDALNDVTPLARARLAKLRK